MKLHPEQAIILIERSIFVVETAFIMLRDDKDVLPMGETLISCIIEQINDKEAITCRFMKL